MKYKRNAFRNTGNLNAFFLSDQLFHDGPQSYVCVTLPAAAAQQVRSLTVNSNKAQVI